MDFFTLWPLNKLWEVDNPVIVEIRTLTVHSVQYGIVRGNHALTACILPLRPFNGYHMRTIIWIPARNYSSQKRILPVCIALHPVYAKLAKYLFQC